MVVPLDKKHSNIYGTGRLFIVCTNVDLSSLSCASLTQSTFYFLKIHSVKVPLNKMKNFVRVVTGLVDHFSFLVVCRSEERNGFYCLCYVQVTGWAVRRSNTGGGTFSMPFQTSPKSPSLLYSFFPWVKAARAWS